MPLTWSAILATRPSERLSIIADALPGQSRKAAHLLAVAIRRPDSLWFETRCEMSGRAWIPIPYRRSVSDWFSLLGGEVAEVTRLPGIAFSEAVRESDDRGWLSEFRDEAECRGFAIEPFEQAEGELRAVKHQPPEGIREGFMLKHSNHLGLGDSLNDFWGWYIESRWTIEAASRAQYLGRSSFATYLFDQVRAYRKAVRRDRRTDLPIAPETPDPGDGGLPDSGLEASELVALVQSVAAEPRFADAPEVQSFAFELCRFLTGSSESPPIWSKHSGDSSRKPDYHLRRRFLDAVKAALTRMNA